MKQQCTGIFGRVSALFLALLMVAGTLFAVIPALPLRVSADTTASSGHAIDFDENIMLSVFWPPTPAYINDEQYRLMADAGINWARARKRLPRLQTRRKCWSCARSTGCI